MEEGERQVAPTLDGIRQDHVERYRLAAERFGGKKVLDIGCGVGYGASILADAGCRVKAADINQEAIDYAREHYSSGNIEYVCAAAEHLGPFQATDAACMFEVVEHLEDPLPALERVGKTCSRLLVSVPNELVFPYRNYKFHHRHYTPQEFEELLNKTGWQVERWWGQEGPDSPCVPDTQGRTLIAECRLEKYPQTGMAAQLPPPPSLVPQSVAIVAMGKSCSTYIRQVSAAGDRRVIADQTWAINSMGSAIAHDLLFHMDDCRVQEQRAAAQPGTNVANMLNWLRRHPNFYTSRKYDDYPGAMEYPLEKVVRMTGVAYFNSTVAYAVALAVAIGVKKIAMYGADYSYSNLHKAERGRGCVEFWLGLAAARGIQIVVAEDTTLLDACEPAERKWYGYDGYKVDLTIDKDNGLQITKTPHDDLPSAAEIEARYCYAPPEPPSAYQAPKSAAA